MKFWELVSAFRSESSLLETVIAEHASPEFRSQYAKFDQFVHDQNRVILDATVPDELVRQIASRSLLTFSLDSTGILRASGSSHVGRTLSALDVVERFGGSVIEEVLERGSSHVGG